MSSNTIAISVVADVKALRNGVNEVNHRLGGMGETAKKAGRLLAAAFITGKVAQWGKEVVSAASDAEQSLGATETVFGKFAKTVTKRSEEAAQAVGLSANSYRELANQTGALLANAGLPMKQVTEITDDLIGRASDLAATFGGTTKDAVSALGSALKGEYDPLEKYGISLKESKVQAILAKKGWDDLTGSAYDQKRALVIRDEVMRQSAKAQGQFARESDTLAGQQQRLAAEFDNVKVKVGNVLLPVLADLMAWVGDKVVPAINDLVDGLEDAGPKFRDIAREVGSTLLPILKDLWDVIQNQLWPAFKTVASIAGDLISVFNKIPDSTKSTIIQLGLAYVAYRKLGGMVGGATTNLTHFFNQMRNGETRTASLKRGIGGLAGAGGLLLLSRQLGKSADDISIWETTLGGVLTGAAVGGPWGAAFGGIAGAIGSLTANMRGGKEAAEAYKPSIDDLAESFDFMRNSASKANREIVMGQILEIPGLLESINAMGIAPRDVIGSILGDPKAAARVNDELRDANNLVGNLQQSGDSMDWVYAGNLSGDLETVTQGLHDIGFAMDDARVMAIETALATGNLKEEFKGIPRKVLTEMATEGVPESRKEARDLAKQYNLTPKQKETLFKVLGVPEVDRDTKKVKNDLTDAGRTKADTKGWTSSLTGDVDDTRRDVIQQTEDIKDRLSDEPSKARADLGGFKSNLSSQLIGIRASAGTQGSGVGSAIGSGINSGASSWLGTVMGTVRGLVSQSIAAARSAAQIKSPSRKMVKIGQQMAEGLVRGIQRNTRKTKNAATKQMRALLRHYNKWQDRLAERIAEKKGYAQAITNGLIGFGSITSTNAAFNSTAMTQAMQARLDKIRQYQDALKTLISRGLNKTTIDQLLQAGVEGGLAYADALVRGPQSAIDEINTIQSQIASVSKSVGDTGAKNMYDAGIKTAQGMVKGLKKAMRKLLKTASNMAKDLVKEVKKALGIKSPSGVFRELGEQTVLGMKIALEDTYAVKKAAYNLGKAVEQGFGNPQFSAMGTVGGGAPTQVTIQVNVPATADQAAIGREIAKSLDAFYAQGGRRRA